MKLERPITPKQRRFVDEYLIDLNATQAAVRAGYSPKTARSIGAENLTKPDIQAAIELSQAERGQRVEITQDYVLTKLKENVERAMQAEPVCDKEGNETGVYTYQGSVANGALQLLGKHLGMFGDKLQIDDLREVSKLSDQELEDRRRKLKLMA